MAKVIVSAVLMMTLSVLAGVPASRPSPVSTKNDSQRLFSVGGVEKSDRLYLRAKPSHRSESIAIISHDATGLVGLGPVQRRGRSIWRKIRYGDLQGWVNDHYLRSESIRTPPTSRFYVTRVAKDDVLYVRVEPSAMSRIVGSTPHDATGIEGLGPVTTKGGSIWRRVRFRSLEGWV